MAFADSSTFESGTPEETLQGSSENDEYLD